MPPQAAGNLFIAHYIARRSLKEIPGPDCQEGLSLPFSGQLFAQLDQPVMNCIMWERPPPGPVPLHHSFCSPFFHISRRKEGGASPLPPHTLEIAIPDSAHHIMIDQPLALISALRGLLAVWPGDAAAR